MIKNMRLFRRAMLMIKVKSSKAESRERKKLEQLLIKLLALKVEQPPTLKVEQPPILKLSRQNTEILSCL